jgi:glutamine phosphoribosylpyrophosphate amidotransferase
MCAVIDIILEKPTKQDFELVRNVFIESKIRGMHATGMSFLPEWSTEIVTIKDAIPADKFVDIHLQDNALSDMLSDDGNLYLIGHCRYSTSDLEYNQPMYRSDRSIVHNGVISQDSPDKWKDKFGLDCITQNDSELVLHSEDPLSQFYDMSMGVCELNVAKTLRVYRNGKRPLYLTNVTNGCIITSTVDIAKRAGIAGETEEIPMNTYITFDEYLTMSVERINIAGAIDYQYELH